MKLAQKLYRSYFVKRFGKVPEVVIEIVSLTRRDEEGEKKEKYAQLEIPYYVIFDPLHQLSKETLTIYQLEHDHYIPFIGHFFPQVGLGLKLWKGTFEGCKAQWLRWFDQDNKIILDGSEKATQETKRADQEKERAEKLAAKLRALGIDPDTLED